MEKGTLIVNKKGNARIKRSDGREVPSPKLYNYKEYTPERGKTRVACEYTTKGENLMIDQVFVEGKELPKDEEAVQAAEAKAQRLQEQAERKAKLAEANKRYAKRIEISKKDSFQLADENTHFYLPKDTLELLEGNEWQVDNYALKLNKAARQEAKTQKFQFFQTHRSKVIYKTQSHEEDFESFAARTRSAAQTICGEAQVKSFKLRTTGRFITGLGEASVYETNIALHHIYGYPYIPATSLKGVVRSWIIQSHFGQVNVPSEEQNYPLVNAEYRAYQNEAFCRVFGCPANADRVPFDSKNKPIEIRSGYKKEKMSVALKNPKTQKGQEHQGSVFFFDAMPITAPKIAVDIMNVHYQDYYSKGKPPVDYLSPNPIPFLAVEDTIFQFVVGSKKSDWLNWKVGGKTIADWTEAALKQHGIGAKTAVGYGYMQ